MLSRGMINNIFRISAAKLRSFSEYALKKQVDFAFISEFIITFAALNLKIMAL
jgi:hypothetical protein